MKKIALILTVLSLSACNPFNSNPLIGKWKSEETKLFGVVVPSVETEITRDEIIGQNGTAAIEKYEVKDKRVYVYPKAANGQSFVVEVIDDDTIRFPAVIGSGTILTRVE